MATAEIYRASGSLRKDSSSIWRNSGAEVFSRTSGDEDDEEALKWAALEKLPTYNRMRKGLLMGSEGEANEVDIHNLGLQERKNLVERLVKIADEDNEKFLLKLKNRIDRSLCRKQSLPSFINSAFNQIEDILNALRILPSRKKKFTILHDVSESSNLEVLERPLSIALSGKLDSSLKVMGSVTYNGHGMNEFVPQRTAAYISQLDTHIGEMTVRETLAFSARCQGVGDRYDMLAELSRREKSANIKPDPDIDVFMKAVAAEGQKENVITDYTLKTKHPHFKGTALISLLQPAPETYNLFDDIILLSDSQIVYQGPREDVLDFFESMGFRCPERKGVADFLQEVTSRKDQEQYWICKDEPYSFVTVKEFAEAFQSFHIGRKLGDELATPFDKTKSHPAAMKTEKYGVRKKELLDACIAREYLLMKRNSFVYIFKLTQLTIMAVIGMTIFLRTEMHKNTTEDGNIYTGALFFIVITVMFNGMSELAMTIVKLPVFYKQRGLLFYPAWAYALPSWFLKIPITFVEVGVWVFITYYVIGFDPNVGRLFRQYLLLLLLNQVASSLFRFIAAASRNMIIANTFGTFALLLLFALGENIKKWWIWVYWSSPLMYAQNAIVNASTTSTESLGVTVLKSRGFFTEAHWCWIGAGALLGFIFVFNFFYTVALTYLNPFEKPQAVITEESDNSKTGGKIELSSHRKGSIDQTASTKRGGEIGRSISSTFSYVTEEAIAEANHNKKKGMVLPFQPHSITLMILDTQLTCQSQGVLEDKLELLKGVSGAFRPGVLTALMGGNISISGYPKKQETFARICGYCEQNDIHSPHVTIHESLLYSAWLRLSPDVDAETRMMFIEEVMELVELIPLRDALVGLPGVNGLSTEQRKRLTIAVELVANPSIIFMDEPTSGLDARAAAIVMRTVRNTVDTGRTVVCTIHQPSIDIFEAFDELLLLKRGGQEIYVGPLGRHSSHLIKYFEGIEGVSKIKDGYNPATWMLEVTTSAQELILGVDFTEIYKTQIYTVLLHPMYGMLMETTLVILAQSTIHGSEIFLHNFHSLDVWDNVLDLGTQRTRQQDLSNAMGSMYAAVIFLGFQNGQSVQPVVVVERTVFYRERAAGMYSAMPYAFAQALVEIPYVFSQAVVYGAIVYAMIGFEWTTAKFFWYIFFTFFSLLYFTFFGMMAVAATPNQHIAAIIAAAFYALWNLFSGFIIPRTRIPVWWRWYYWACPVAWTLYGLVTSQYGDIEDRLLDTNVTVKQYLDDYFGFEHDFLGVVAAVIVGFTVLFLFIFAFSIKAFNFQRR
ncbi:Pleiotropic drug resistance protein 1 [Vitis vinifera]|uniref:Pleiotropic drug resistance protein 1 n=1 Tax=Vitis vinifera TaxID=29760 RepID=A0A438GXZ8_VITVI|nr:Pleiotropic drug resistance protein 1 [Vitis vinifera]